MSEELLTGRILLVEDDSNAAAILSQVLRSVGNDVEIADDGRQALTKIEGFEPDVILLDLQMPGRDGFELARLIRVNPRQAQIPIIMMSGLSDREVRLRAIHCGADDFIAKPLTTEDLFTRIGNALRLLALRREMVGLRKENGKMKASGSGASVGSVEGLKSCIDSASAALRRSLLNWVDETDDDQKDVVGRGAAVESVAKESRFDESDSDETEQPAGVVEAPPAFDRAISPAGSALPKFNRDTTGLPG
jgi:DNA-binding response OmpR family regulator